MHAGIRADMPGTFDDINQGGAAKEITAWDDTKAAMVKAQIVPAFCTLPEAVEAAVDELQADLGGAPGERTGGRSRHARVRRALQALLAVGKSSLFEPEGPLWFRGYATWPDKQETSDTLVTPLLARVSASSGSSPGHTPQPGKSCRASTTASS